MSPGEATFKYPISEGCEGDKQRDNSRLSASPSGFASCVAFGLWRASGGSRGGKLKSKFPLWRHFTNPARPSAAACAAPTPPPASRRGSVGPWSTPFAWPRAPTLLLQPSSRWSSSARNPPRLLVALTSTRRLEPSPAGSLCPPLARPGATAALLAALLEKQLQLPPAPWPGTWVAQLGQSSSASQTLGGKDTPPNPGGTG